MTPDALRQVLAAGPWPVDGGLASQLEARGADISGALWSGRVLLEDPDAVRAVHAEYLAAGARVVISASYQVSREGFLALGRSAAEADAALARSVAVAREAVDAALAAGASGPRLVAASVGPYGAITHDGAEYRGRYGLSRSALVDFHRARLDVLAAAGPDLLAVETIPDADEAAALVEVLADHPELAAWVSFSCRDGQHVNAGQRFEEAVTVAAAAPTVVAVGVNCTPPEHVASLLAAARSAVPLLPLVAYPNAGRGWDPVQECWFGDGVDTLPEPVVRGWVAAGAALVGGCCGLGPTAVADLDRTLAPLRPAPPA